MRGRDMKKYMMICFVVQQSMIVAMDIRKNDMAEVKKMEALRLIRKRASIESMENSTQSSEDMSLSRSGSGSFSLKKQLSNYSISGLVGSPPKREPSQFLHEQEIL